MSGEEMELETCLKKQTGRIVKCVECVCVRVYICLKKKKNPKPNAKTRRPIKRLFEQIREKVTKPGPRRQNGGLETGWV